MNTTPRVPATVQNLIPNTADYSSFTRVFHTISSSGERIAWAVLAKQRGLLLEADTQFQDIDPDAGHAWRGTLDRDSYRRLLGLLPKPADDSYRAALWVGKQWNYSDLSRTATIGSNMRPQRSYFVGRLSAAEVMEVGTVGPYRGLWSQPTVLWVENGPPWCVFSDPDFDSTIVASDMEIQSRLLKDDLLESLPISRSVSLSLP